MLYEGTRKTLKGPLSTILVVASLGVVTGCQTVAQRLTELDTAAPSATLENAVDVTDAGKKAEVVTLQARPGGMESFLFIKADHPIANAVLFAGGGGDVQLRAEKGKAALADGNFLVRMRAMFVHDGLNVAVVDAPSDHKGSRGMMGGFRNSAEHLKDIEGVIAYLHKDNGLPVWLIGTSRGTESAAFIAVNSRQKIDGLVLTSSITVSNSSGTSITDLPLKQIKVPVEIVAHKDDKCAVTPPGNTEMLASDLSGASKVDVKIVSGGSRPRSGPCDALSAHGFYGAEFDAVVPITDFVKNNV